VTEIPSHLRDWRLKSLLVDGQGMEVNGISTS